MYQNINKPITVKSSLKELDSWLIEKILDSYVNPYITNGIYHNFLLKDPREGIEHLLKRHLPIDNFNTILSTIFGERTNIQKLFSHRYKIALMRKGNILASSLASLSTGQAQLVGIFRTILRYADRYRPMPIPMKEIEGIVVVDEVDTHLHGDYLYYILPKLIQLFPKVQFIITCHAPLFPLGMEKLFREEGFSIIELPEGKFITSERYSEFKTAFTYMEETKAFEEKLSEYHHKPHILCEGPTDPRYLKKAAKLFGFADFLDEEKIIIKHIGHIGKKGSPKGSGADALKTAQTHYQDNPDLLHHPIMLLFDCDQKNNIKDKPEGKLFTHIIQQNTDNNLYKKGIENLLSKALFEKIKDTPELKEKYLPSKTIDEGLEEFSKPMLDKIKLCNALCIDNNDDIKEEFGLSVQEIFAEFKPLLMEINAIFFPKKEHDKS